MGEDRRLGRRSVSGSSHRLLFSLGAAFAAALALSACSWFREASLTPPKPRERQDAVSALRRDVVAQNRLLVCLIPKQSLSEEEVRRGREALTNAAHGAGLDVEWRILEGQDVPGALRAGRGDVAIGKTSEQEEGMFRGIDCGNGISLMLRAGDPWLETQLTRGATEKAAAE